MATTQRTRCQPKLVLGLLPGVRIASRLSQGSSGDDTLATVCDPFGIGPWPTL